MTETKYTIEQYKNWSKKQLWLRTVEKQQILELTQRNVIQRNSIVFDTPGGSVVESFLNWTPTGVKYCAIENNPDYVSEMAKELKKVEISLGNRTLEDIASIKTKNAFTWEEKSILFDGDYFTGIKEISKDGNKISVLKLCITNKTWPRLNELQNHEQKLLQATQEINLTDRFSIIVGCSDRGSIVIDDSGKRWPAKKANDYCAERFKKELEKIFPLVDLKTYHHGNPSKGLGLFFSAMFVITT